MKLTLYKNCILSNDYNEVFNPYNTGTTTENYLIDNYLAILDKVEFDIPDIYPRMNGTLNLQQTPYQTFSIFDYNYLVLEYDYQPSKKYYCFINYVTPLNGLAVIDYTVDIWHTFMRDCFMRESMLSNALIVPENYIKKLPVDYQSNDGLYKAGATINSVEYYNVLVTFQVYDVVEEGEVSVSHVYTGLAHTYGTDSYNLSYTDAIQLISNLIIYQAIPGNIIDPGVTGAANRSYNIEAIYLLPSWLNAFNTFGGDTSTHYSIKARDLSTVAIEITRYVSGTNGVLPLQYTKVFEYNILPSFQNILVGNESINFPLDENGKNTTLNVSIALTQYEFSVIANVNGNITDITSYYNIDLPFGSITADVTAQRQIAKMMKQTQAYLNIGSGVMSTVSGVENVVSGIGSLLLAPGIPWELSRYKTTTSGTSSIVGGTNEIYNGVSSIVYNAKNLQENINAKKTTTVFASKAGKTLQSIIEPWTIFYIKPDNETEVNNTIQNVGYRVGFFVNELNYFDDDTVNKNVVKFAMIRLFGKAPQNIIQGLKNILSNGVKIWYNLNQLN